MNYDLGALPKWGTHRDQPAEAKLGQRRIDIRRPSIECRDLASDELFRRHADWLRQLLSRRLRAQPADIDDLVQETYLRATRRPAAEISHPKAFLSQIALNLFRDAKRREAVRADHCR